jgi:hypothetical protein
MEVSKMLLVNERMRRRLAVSLGFCLTLASVGPSIALACEGGGEEIPLRVLTVEKAGGPEADVGDAVKAALETGTKSQFIKTEGEIACGKSEMLGKIDSNPVSGLGKGEMKLETFSFGECTTNIPGLTVKRVAIETFPLLALTVGTTGIEITENGINFGVELTTESGGEEKICAYRTGVLNTTYRNNNGGEIEISQELSGVGNKRNCGAPPPAPTWKAKYRPLQDETGGRAGKQIFIN